MTTSDQQLNHAVYERMKKYQEIVNLDPFRLNYHLMPPIGLLNDPNGLIYYQGNYHVFFQWNPWETAHGKKFWGHYMSEDLIHWKFAPIALAPDSWFDKNGCYSGSAIVDNEKLYLIYTGNVKDEFGNRESYQCLAVSDDGISFDKIGPVIDVPDGYTAHFRDPKVFKKGSFWYMVLGAQTDDQQGEVVLYRSENLQTWTFLGPIAGSKRNGLGEFGYMWECPDLFSLNGKDILIVSPQGLEPKGMLYQNIYQSGYFEGELDYDSTTFSHGSFTELDRGFDFYAPQTFEVGDKRIMIGWMGNAEEEGMIQPTVKHEWIHALTLPRELEWRNNTLYQTPVKELEQLREQEVSFHDAMLSNHTREFDGVCGNVFELKVSITSWEATSFSIVIAENNQVTFDAENAVLSFKRQGLTGKIESRSCQLSELTSIRIFKDTSSIEIFVNDGEEVFSSRQFDDPKLDKIEFSATGEMTLNISKWSLSNLEYR